MKNIYLISTYGLIFGLIGTSLGGILGAFINVKSKKMLSFILELASGLMTSVICFDLIPESLFSLNITCTIMSIFFGITCMIFFNNLITKLYSKKSASNTLLKSGLIIASGIALHNFPEGLAIGSGFNFSQNFGLKLAIAIAIHDIPEGISVALPLKAGGSSKTKSILITFLSGLSTGIGALIGALLGNLSSFWFSFSLSFAAGAMLYIVSCELIPESQKLYNGKFTSFGNIIGFILGLLAHSI